MAWEFKREEQKFELLPEGKYRIRVKNAEKAQSRNGNDMLVLQFEVSGSSKILWHYIVFLPNNPEITNRMLTQFFDSFAGIEEGDLNMNHWIGKTGACVVKHKPDNNDELRERISYFISADKQDDLPAWNDGENSGSTFEQLSDDDMPF